MAVPAHDQRDLDFARAFDLPVRVVVDTTAPITGALPIIELDEDGVPIMPADLLDDQHPAKTGIALTGDGRMVNSGELNGLSKRNAIARAIEQLEAAGTGRKSEELPPARLADLPPALLGHPDPDAAHPGWRDRAGPRGAAAGASCPVWRAWTCRRRGPVRWARRSRGCARSTRPRASRRCATRTRWTRSWTAPGTTCASCRRTATRSRSTRTRHGGGRPIDAYVGGVEHAILHLLYARFITKVLFDMGLIDFTEPFSSLINQGMVILDGAKMSKSKGNLVLFQEELDALRRGCAARRARLRRPGGGRQGLEGRLDHRRAEVPGARAARGARRRQPGRRDLRRR